MHDYIQYIKNISNTLAAKGSPLSDGDLFFYTLGGLGSDYQAFITLLRLKICALSFVTKNCDFHPFIMTPLLSLPWPPTTPLPPFWVNLPQKDNRISIPRFRFVDEKAVAAVVLLPHAFLGEFPSSIRIKILNC